MSGGIRGAVNGSAGIVVKGAGVTVLAALVSWLVQWGSTKEKLRQYDEHLIESRPIVQRLIITESNVTYVLEAQNRQYQQTQELIREIKGLRHDVDRLIGEEQGRKGGK